MKLRPIFLAHREAFSLGSTGVAGPRKRAGGESQVLEAELPVGAFAADDAAARSAVVAPKAHGKGHLAPHTPGSARCKGEGEGKGKGAHRKERGCASGALQKKWRKGAQGHPKIGAQCFLQPWGFSRRSGAVLQL